MNSYVKNGRQPEVLRTTQKDLEHTSFLHGHLMEIVRFAVGNNPNLIKLNESTRQLSNILYHGFAALNRVQTLGEEYTGVIQLNPNTKNLPSRFIQLLSIILEYSGETFLMKFLKSYEKKVELSEDLLPEAKVLIQKLIKAVRFSIPYIKTLHRGLFYLNSGHLQISKRITGIHYVLVRFWLDEQMSLSGYKILGFITILQVLLSLFIKYKEKVIEKQTEINTKYTKNKQVVASRNDVETKRCVLCLEGRENLSSTLCGHLFCWYCILEQLKFKNECPICREHLKQTHVIFLQNYS